MCGPNFCSMKITDDLRKYAVENGLTGEEALTKGMDEKSDQFKEKSGEVYVGQMSDEVFFSKVPSTNLAPDCHRQNEPFPAVSFPQLHGQCDVSCELNRSFSLRSPGPPRSLAQHSCATYAP